MRQAPKQWTHARSHVASYDVEIPAGHEPGSRVGKGGNIKRRIEGHDFGAESALHCAEAGRAKKGVQMGAGDSGGPDRFRFALPQVVEGSQQKRCGSMHVVGRGKQIGKVGYCPRWWLVETVGDVTQRLAS